MMASDQCDDGGFGAIGGLEKGKCEDDPAEDSKQTKDHLALTQTRTNERPRCFKSTTAEVLFIFTATMANAMTSFVAGSTQVITNSIGNDLGATSAEITWITASLS